MNKATNVPEARVLLVLLIAICSLVAFSLPALGVEQGGDALNEEIEKSISEGAGSPGSDGSSDACVGQCPGGDAGTSGRTGQSRKGNDSGRQGQQASPTPAPTSVSSGSRTSSTSRRRTAASSGSSTRSGEDSEIETILLYPETATPIPDPLPTSVESAKEPAESSASENETSSEQAARPVQEPVRETSGGGFPARRVLGILAALVAVGAAWSLLMQGRRKPGRRSVGRRAPRRL